MSSNQKKPKIWRGILVGLVAGLAASWTMDRFQDVWIAVSSPDDSKKKEDETDPSEDGEERQDDATVRAASAISEGLFEHKLTKGEKRWPDRPSITAWAQPAGSSMALRLSFCPK